MQPLPKIYFRKNAIELSYFLSQRFPESLAPPGFVIKLPITLSPSATERISDKMRMKHIYKFPALLKASYLPQTPTLGNKTLHHVVLRKRAVAYGTSARDTTSAYVGPEVGPYCEPVRTKVGFLTREVAQKQDSSTSRTATDNQLNCQRLRSIYEVTGYVQ